MNAQSVLYKISIYLCAIFLPQRIFHPTPRLILFRKSFAKTSQIFRISYASTTHFSRLSSKIAHFIDIFLVARACDSHPHSGPLSLPR